MASNPAADDVFVSLLGPVTVLRSGGAVPVSGAKQRAMLALLALQAGRVVSVERVVAALWGDEPPATATNSVQVCASGLRQALGGPLIRWRDPGYVLDLPPERTDVGQFHSLAEQARQAARAHRWARAVELFDQALGLWHGDGLAFGPGALLTSAADRLREARLSAVEDRAEAALRLGRHEEVADRVAEALADHPLRERLWALRMRALYHSGRQADALDEYRRARRVLAEELGIEPGAELRALEGAILAQDVDDPAGAPSRPPEAPTIRRPQLDPAVSGYLLLPDGRRVAVGTEPLVIGRSSECDVVVPDGGVSRRHAEVAWRSGRHEITDLRSTNGTNVNGLPLTPHRPRALAHGDEIQIGVHTVGYGRG